VARRAGAGPAEAAQRAALEQPRDRDGAIENARRFLAATRTAAAPKT